MNYMAFRCNSQKQYLGYCEKKGFIYSVQIDAGKYAVVALQNSNITFLIIHTAQVSVVNR